MPDERILLISGLPAKQCQEKEKLYSFFGKYGAIQQLRVGCSPISKGFCIVVYERCESAKIAMEKLNGYKEGKIHLRVAVFDERDKAGLERRKRKREVQSEYKKHIVASAEGTEEKP